MKPQIEGGSSKAKSKSKGKAGSSGKGGFEAFFRAIGGQESGGDYNATNSRTGASGKYQIMPGNIRPWARQYLGIDITVQQFKRDPALQERLARAVLSSYYSKYGARGAAAAWYSGQAKRQNDYSSIGHGNEPSVGQYVDSVMGRMGKGGGGGYSGGSSAPTAHAAPIPVVHNLGHLDGAPVAEQAPSMGHVDFLRSNIAPGLAGGIGDPFASNITSPFAPMASMPSTPTTSSWSPSAPDVAVAPTAPRQPGESGAAFRDRVLAEAMKYIGTPYVWGGQAPGGFDCSGIIKYVYGKYGFSMPRISADQARYGKRTSIGSLRPGDLVAWDNSSRNNGADHIAIYAGNGYIIEAPRAGKDVRRRKLGKNENAWGVQLDLPGD